MRGRRALVGLAQVHIGANVFGLESQHMKNGMPRAVPIHPRVAHIVRNAALWPIRPIKWTVRKAFKAEARAASYGHALLHDLRLSTAQQVR